MEREKDAMDPLGCRNHVWVFYFKPKTQEYRWKMQKYGLLPKALMTRTSRPSFIDYKTAVLRAGLIRIVISVATHHGFRIFSHDVSAK